MNLLPRIVSTTLLAAAAVLSAVPLVAQAPQEADGGQAALTSGDATRELTIAEVEPELAAMEANSGIEDAVKELLRPKYKQAIQALKDAADNAAKAANYREATKTGPESASALRAESQALPSAEDAAKDIPAGSTEGLQKDIDSRQAALDGLNDNLSEITAELARVKGRPVEISNRLPEAQRELADIQTQLARPELAEDATSPQRIADRILLEAQRSKLLSELEMVKEEQASQSLREDLLQARRDLLERQVENASAALDALQALVRQRLSNEAKQIGSLADEIRQDIPEDDEAAQALAAELQALAKEFEDVVGRLKQVSAAQDDVKAQRKLLIDEYDRINQELKSGGAGAATAQVLFDLQRQLAHGGSYSVSLSAPEATLEETRLAAHDVEKKLRGQLDVEKQCVDHPSEAVARVVAYRRDVLEKLRTQYGNLIRTRAALESEQRQYLDKAREVRHWILKQLFWMRSSPPIGLTTFTDSPAGFRWMFSVKHWAEFGDALEWIAARMPVRSTIVLLVVAMLLVFRRTMVKALERAGFEVHRISTDRYAHTARALFWTVLLAVPVSLLIGFGGWALGQFPEPTGWMRGTVLGLSLAAWIVYVTAFLAEFCRPGGLGTAHFGWPEEPLARFRRSLTLFAAVYIPALLLTCSTAYGEASHYFESLGRISFIVAHIWTAYVLQRTISSSDGILSRLIREHPNRFVIRCRYLWYPLVIGWPVALVVLASLGYLLTAIDLSLGLLSTIALIAGGVILYWLALRWFLIRKRKLALDEALEKRRGRQEAAASEAQQEQSGEVVTVDPEDEEGMDLESIDVQTRHLLRLLFSLCVFVAIVLFWSETIPLISVLDEIPIPLTGGLTLLGLLQAVLIVVVTYVAVQNLPGVLELGLRGSANEPGRRHAISTLCQYSATAIGIVLLLGVLDVDWAKFGWIAAGLSVGIGFGLQEVVSNLVCGLILLFESPIRMGDVVTVEGTTGTVTKIRMRATTITNWDRQEFVVPNKNLITGTILNWTLTASINRIIIPVGVAYGTDTEKARQILLDVAADHPRVVDDPAPMATFEAFADSSLTLRLLAYVPDVENRRGTITELHAEIDKRFAEAGIEIAFPQQDLHLRTGWDDIRREGAAAAEAGNERK